MNENTPWQTSHAEEALSTSIQGIRVFCKFLSANDTGQTGAHQSGIYIAKSAVPIIFNHPFSKGQKHDRWIKITWQDGSVTDGHCIYYGEKTRDEYRLTGFGRDFPYIHPDYTGALFVLVQMTEDDYYGFILNTDYEINYFLNSYGLSPEQTNRLIATAPLSSEQTNRLIVTEQLPPELRIALEIKNFLKRSNYTFPSSLAMSTEARILCYLNGMSKTLAITDPDKTLLALTDSEYKLFNTIENDIYLPRVKRGFDTLNEFLALANQILNRRKSRAGKSLEHHLEDIFTSNHLQFTAQGVTEEKKRPDFIFPSIEAYHDPAFSADNIITLAAKTTCRDRWRQILNEADRRRNKDKYLCTLQQGISPSQMDEMQAERVVLVVPKKYITAYPSDKRDRIWTLSKFISFVKEKEGL